MGYEYQSRTLHAFIFSKRLVLQRDKFKPLSFLSEEIKNKLAKFVLMNTPSVEVKIFRETDVSGNPEEPQPSEQQIAEGILESISGNDHNDGDGHNNFYDPPAPVSGHERQIGQNKNSIPDTSSRRRERWRGRS